MKKIILILLGLIAILLSNPVNARIFVCPPTPLNPIGYPCSIPPGTITAANFQFLGTGLITAPSSLISNGGTLTFQNGDVARGKFQYDSIFNNVIIVDGTLLFANRNIFAGKGNYNTISKVLNIQDGAFNSLLVKNALYGIDRKLEVFRGAVKVDEWMDVNGASDLKWQRNGFSGVTGMPFFRIQTPEGIIMTKQDGLQFEYKGGSIEFKSTTYVIGFTIEYNDFRLKVKSMLPDGSILIDFINNKIVTNKTRTNFRFNSEEVINLNAINESSIFLNENKIECGSCKIDVKSAHHTLNFVALDDSSIEMPDGYTHNVEGFGELTINADGFTMNGMLGHSTGDGEVTKGEVRHHEDETTKQHTVEGRNFHGRVYGKGPALIDTQDSSMGVGHIGEGNGDEDDTHIEFALGYTSATVTDLLSQSMDMPGMEMGVPAKPAAGDVKMRPEEEANKIAERSLGAVERFLVGSMSRTLLTATRAPEGIGLDKGGLSLNRFGEGEVNHNMPNGQSARILLNLGTQEAVSNLLTERSGRLNFYPSLTTSYPVGSFTPSVELKPLEGSLSFTVRYPLAGGTLKFKRDIGTGISTLVFKREPFEITMQRNFLGVGGQAGVIPSTDIPLIVYFGYGTPDGGLGHSGGH